MSMSIVNSKNHYIILNHRNNIIQDIQDTNHTQPTDALTCSWNEEIAAKMQVLRKWSSSLHGGTSSSEHPGCVLRSPAQSTSAQIPRGRNSLRGSESELWQPVEKKDIRQIDTSNKPIIIMINALMHWRLWLCKFHEASPAKKDPSSIGVFWRPYFDLVVYTPPKLQSHGRFHLFTSASPTPTSSMKYTKGPAALFFALGLSIRGSPK